MFRLIIMTLLLSLTACQETEVPEKRVNWTKEKSTELNKEIAEQEKIDVRLYCERIPNSTFIETGSGLLYWVKKKGDGPLAQPGDLAQVSYVISLLDGTVCYETKSDELNEFLVDKSNVETGIQEAIKLLNKGAKAKLIVSSYLAHGLTGDMNKIPPLTPIVVDMEVLNIISKR